MPYKRDKAVALQYDIDDHVPRVIAAGAGEIARRIIEIAKENNIPIHKNDSLADILSRIDIEQEIPEETYILVAEILAFLYRTDAAWRKRKEEQFQVLLGQKNSLESKANSMETK